MKYFTDTLKFYHLYISLFTSEAKVHLLNGKLTYLKFNQEISRIYPIEGNFCVDYLVSSKNKNDPQMVAWTDPLSCLLRRSYNEELVVFPIGKNKTDLLFHFPLQSIWIRGRQPLLPMFQLWPPTGQWNCYCSLPDCSVVALAQESPVEHLTQGTE